MTLFEPPQGVEPGSNPQPAGTPSPTGQGLAITALVLGIVAALAAIIPGLSFPAWIPAGTAMALGIVVLVSVRPGRGKAISAVASGAVALAISLVVSITSVLSSQWPLAGVQSVQSNQSSQQDSEPAPEGNESDSPEQSDEADVTYDVPIPDGYEDLGTGVAFTFTDDECVNYEYCVSVALFAYTDCPAGVEVIANQIDYDTDTIFAQTREESGILYAGEYGFVELNVPDNRANGASIVDIACYY